MVGSNFLSSGRLYGTEQRLTGQKPLSQTTCDSTKSLTIEDQERRRQRTGNVSIRIKIRLQACITILNLH